MRFGWVVLSVALLLACDWERDATVPTRSTDAQPLEAPTLLAPEADAAIRQNDAGLGCPDHWARGFGFEIRFEWRDASSAEASYEVLVKHPSGSQPLVNQLVRESSLVFRSCNGFVIDANLDGWEWRVRAVDASFNTSEWSETRRFHFEPCRTANGQLCSAPLE